MGPWLVDVRTREEFDTWMGDSPPLSYRPVVMVVRGDSPIIREFIPNALDAAKLDEHRLVVWVKNESIMTDREIAEVFDDDDDALAAVLSEGHRSTAMIHGDRIEVEDASFAFSTAQ